MLLFLCWFIVILLFIIRDENSQKTSPPFSTSTFEYENESKSGKTGHKNEHELMKYQEF